MSYRMNGGLCYINRISYYRKLRGFSQTDLAKYCGLTKASISKLENSNNGTTVYVALILCSVLGCKFEDLFILNKELVNEKQNFKK